MAVVRLAAYALSLFLCVGCLDDYGRYDFVTDFDAGATPNEPSSPGAASSSAAPAEPTAAMPAGPQVSAPPADSSEFEPAPEPVADRPLSTQADTTP
jgi:hypothetical protein